MDLLRILVVDDTPIAREILEGYIVDLPHLQLVGSCKDAMEAYSIMADTEIDLLLLDINMPKMSGMELIKTLKKPPMVIFTTAYSEFAADSYEINAVDYLLKPISFDRFLKALDKVVSLRSQMFPKQADASKLLKDVLFVRVDRKMVKIDLNKLWLIEGDKVYTKLWVDQTNLLVYGTMKNIESQLAHLPQFLRVSKSFIINIKFVNEVDGNLIRINQRSVLIGSTYRDEIKQRFDNYKLF